MKTLPAIAVIIATLCVSACSENNDAETSAPAGEKHSDVAARSAAYQRLAPEIEKLSELAKKQPKNAGLHVKLGKILLEAGAYEKAEEHLSLALALRPTLDEAITLLFQSAVERGDPAVAAAALAEARKHHESAATWTAQGKLYLLGGLEDPSEAEQAFRKAIDLDGKCIDALFELALVRLSAGDAEESIQLLRRVVALQNNHLGAHFTLVRALRKAGRMEEAIESAKTHKRLSYLEDLGFLDRPYSMKAYLAVAELLLEGGDRDGCMEQLEGALARFPSEPMPWVKKALAEIRFGEQEGARATFEAALEALPQDAIIHNQYAWYLATTSTDPEELDRAVVLARQAVRLSRRGNSNMLDTLAEALASTGDFARALTIMDEAIRRNPGDQQLRHHRAQIKQRSGDTP